MPSYDNTQTKMYRNVDLGFPFQFSQGTLHQLHRQTDVPLDVN
jgi:hypothetical protein